MATNAIISFNQQVEIFLPSLESPIHTLWIKMLPSFINWFDTFAFSLEIYLVKKEQKTINITILVHVLIHLIQLKHSIDQRKYIDSLTKSHKFTISLCLVLSNELDLQQQWDYVITLKILQIFNFTISSDQPLSYIPTFFITKKSREKKCKFST